MSQHHDSKVHGAPYVAAILDKLDNVRPAGRGWTARCPAHKDRKNSLSIGVGDDGQVLLHCHANCDPGMVLYHKGLTFADLYPPRTETTLSNGARRRRPPISPTPPSDPPADDLAKQAAHLIGTTRYEIRDASGVVVAVHARNDFDDGTKTLWWERPDGGKGLGGKRLETLPLYGIHKLGTAPTVFICEGEKAAKALRDMGVAAVGTVTGAGTCPSEDSLRPLLGRTLVLWPDNDTAGDEHADAIGARLRKMGQPETQLFRFDWADAPAKGDAADYVERGETKLGLKALVERTAQLWRPRPATGTSATGSSSAPASGASPKIKLDKEPSQATKLATMVRDSDAELFHDTSGDTYITVTVYDHRETHLLRGRSAREWLRHAFYEKEDTAPSGNALRDAIEQLSAEATFAGECHTVHVRRAGDDDAIYLDLGDDDWQVAHVTATEWQVVPAADAPVRFRRPSGMLALPVPAAGGNLQLLRPLVNVANDDAFALVVAWLLGALKPRGPYPILALSGEQGAAKSTLARTLRLLIDPNVAPLRTTPREEGDLMIAAKHGLVCCFDNVSSLSDAMSDALCRLATGGGLGKRTLYTDVDETLLDATRPVLLTGIETALTRGDAIDRALLVELERIPKARRRTESEINAELDAMRPAVLGALLTEASAALANWPTTRPENLPRMADFGRWVEAGASAIGWHPGAFLALYDTNRDEADELVVEAEPVGPALRAFIDARGTWTGTASELLSALNEAAGEKATRAKDWPKTARGLSGHIKRITPSLLRLGYSVETGKREGHAGRRQMTLGVQEGGKDRQHRQHRQEPHNHADSGLTAVENASSADASQSSALGSADGWPPTADGSLTVAENESSAENPHDRANFDPIGASADDADGYDPYSPPTALFAATDAPDTIAAETADGEPGDDRWTA